MEARKSIVVLGAGFGGLRAALRLGRYLKAYKLADKYEVVLIDKNDYHTYTPTLYEIATTSKETANFFNLKEIVTFNVASMIAWLPIRFIKAEVTNIDVAHGDIHLSTGERLIFCNLLLALGSQTNYFDIPGLKENSQALKTFHDAVMLREVMTTKVMERENSPLRIVIGGGGSTGVELAGEIKLWLCGPTAEIKNTCSTSIEIIDGAPSVLSAFDPRLVARAEKRLKKLGIAVRTNERIASVSQNSLLLKSGATVPFDILVWTGGVKANQLAYAASMKRDQSGKVLTGHDMQCVPEADNLRFHGSIYGIGDSICFINPKTNAPVPGTARAAMIQATIAAHNIMQEILVAEGKIKQVNLKSYVPLNYPYVIPIGGKFAIAKLGSFIISGFWGWVLKGLIELNYLFSIMPLRRAIPIWFKGLSIFIKNDRLG